jgi:hypothetical protein
MKKPKRREQGNRNTRHCALTKTWKRIITYFKPEILKRGNEKEIWRELLRYFKAALKELQSDKGAGY